MARIYELETEMDGEIYRFSSIEELAQFARHMDLNFGYSPAGEILALLDSVMNSVPLYERGNEDSGWADGQARRVF